MTEDFMNRLARMENEVSMMRSGYNDGIERYRTVLQRFPEVILAKLFRFENHKSLNFSSRIREVPKISSLSSEVESDEIKNPPSKNTENVFDKKVSESIAGEQLEDQAKPLETESSELSNIYLRKEGKQYGPYTSNEVLGFLENKKFTLEDLACWDGKTWHEILKIPGLNITKNSD
jgi:hypothetical protein